MFGFSQFAIECLSLVESPQPPPRVSRHRLQSTPNQNSNSECCFRFCFLRFLVVERFRSSA